MTDREPQPVMLSTNHCPNGSDDHLRVGATGCNPDALTIYGYCGICWQTPGRIPAAWVASIDDMLTADDRGGAA